MSAGDEDLFISQPTTLYYNCDIFLWRESVCAVAGCFCVDEEWKKGKFSLKWAHEIIMVPVGNEHNFSLEYTPSQNYSGERRQSDDMKCLSSLRIDNRRRQRCRRLPQQQQQRKATQLTRAEKCWTLSRLWLNRSESDCFNMLACLSELAKTLLVHSR